MRDHREVSLSTINQGHVVDLFEEAMRKVMENIADENTPPTKERVITIKISVKPNEEREHAVTRVGVTTTLAPVKPSESIVLFSYDGSTARAYVSNPKQEELPLTDNRVPIAAGGGH